MSPEPFDGLFGSTSLGFIGSPDSGLIDIFVGFTCRFFVASINANFFRRLQL